MLDRERMSGAPVSRYANVHVRAWECLSAAGNAAESWQACRAGRSALRNIAPIGWCGTLGVSPDARTIDDIAIAAATKPWRSIADSNGMLALSASSSKGDSAALARALRGESRDLLRCLPGHLHEKIAASLRLPRFVPCPLAAACSTGLYAVLAAADFIDNGLCTRALAGSADASLQPLLLAGFDALGVLCGERKPQVFAEATGFAPAEGAGFFALAHDGPWRLVAGVRIGDAGHETQFTDPRTLRACLEALWSVSPDPELIVVHGTGTASGDAYEVAAYDDGPWSRAPRLACKAVLGHCLGASGSVELALALEAPVQRLWKISLGFGGHLAGLALERADR